MKLRQKLAAVMAATMVVTAVPVVTMADTTNSIANTIKVVKDDTMGFKIDEEVDASTTYSVYKTNKAGNEYKYRYIPTLELQPTASYNLSAGSETFFVQVNNATLSNEAFLAYIAGEDLKVNKATGLIENATGTAAAWKGYKAADILEGKVSGVDVPTLKLDLNGNKTADANCIEISKVSSTELKVKVSLDVTKSDVVKVPLFAVAKTGEVSVTIDGSESFVTSETLVIGSTTESNKQISVTAGETAKLTVDGGKISDIILSEQVLNAFKEATDKVIKVELPASTDLEFKEGEITLKGGRGFAGKTETVKAVFGKTLRGDKDRQVLEITIPAGWEDPSARGTISLQGIQVVPEGKTAKTGEVKVTVSNEHMTDTTLTVATINDHAVTLDVEKTAEVVSGKDAKTVTFTLAEGVKDTIVDGRRADFTLENGFIAVRDYDAATGTYASALETFQRLVKEKKIVLPEEVKLEDITAVEANSEGQITGFTVTFDHIDTTKASSLEFKMPVMTELTASGEVKLTVEGRALANKVEAVIANAKAPFELTTEAVELKVGLNGQAGGSIKISETDKQMFDKGQVEISIPSNTGISFVKNQDLDIVAEGLRIKDVKVSTNTITFAVDRTSEEAGSITIKNIGFNVDRTTPQGEFDLEIAGSALTENEYIKAGVDRLTVKDFVVIGTANTEDLAQNGLKKGTASFTINSNKYIVNGKEKEMDGTTYASNGRTMVPVRYVSEAFGIDGNNVLFNKGVVTLFAGNRIVQLKVGSNVAVVNGTSIAMDEAVAVKDGRTYIPMGEIGRILGVNVSWDNDTKTATFKN